VQGEGAAADIAKAIHEFNQFAKVDVLIVGRGGGSLEDLWAFNEEVVARAIFDSKIPIISAVGHEIDFTIADFVADLRAPTPSAAAELAVPNYVELKQKVLRFARQMERAVLNRIAQYRQQVMALKRSYGLRRPEDLLHQLSLRVDELEVHLNKNMERTLLHKKQLVDQWAARLSNLNPRKVLERGYSITYIDGSVVKSSAEARPDQTMTTELFRGKIVSKITKIE
jgi:exodeoxyribonuclease VII large subunit